MKTWLNFNVLVTISGLFVFSGALGATGRVQGADSALVEGGDAADTDDDYRPGKTNPVKNPGRLYLMKDDILCALFGKPGDNTLTRNWNKPTGTDLTAWANDTSAVLNEPDYGNGLNKGVISPTALAMGRINGPQKDDVVGAFYYIDGKKVKPYVFFVDSPGVNTKATNAFSEISIGDDTSYDNYYSIDVAVGDVDRKLNPDGEYNDEIVVAFHMKDPYQGEDLCVAVLDKDLKLMDYGWTYSGLDYPTGNNDYTRPYFSVAMGDYDNDGMYEIAVGFRTEDSHGGNQKYEVDTFKYCSDAGGLWMDYYTYSLDLSGTFQYNAVDLTSGDYNGDGIDEIAVSISAFQNTDTYDMVNLAPYLLIFTADKNLKLAKKGSWHPKDGSDFNCGSVRGVGLTSGLFKYNPAESYTTARRQIAMAGISFQGKKYWFNVTTFDINDDFKLSVADYTVAYDGIGYDDDNTSIPKITSGNFKGIDNNTVTEQLAVSWADSKHPKFAVYDVDNDLHFSLKYQGDFQPGHPDENDQQYSSVPIVAADRDGKGYYLGAPIHLKVPQYIRPIYVMQEPPKHLDYLPDDRDQWQIVRVSRNRQFYASFADKWGTTFTSTHETRTNFDIGGSEKVSAKQTVATEVGIDDADVTLKESEKLSYDYDSVTSKLNGKYTSITGSAQYNADRDDYIQTHQKIIDIWRFPIYGLKTQDKLNGFYEVVMPGPTTEILDTWGFDLSDYYQPIHENGNILSYPQISDEKWPEDLGSFTVCDANGKNCQDISSGMSKNDLVETWGSGSGTRAVTWESDSWSTDEKSHTHKLNFNLDFQVAFHTDATEILEKEEWYASVDLSFHRNKSWSTTDFSKNTMSSSKGISLTFPSIGNADQAYAFKPVLYSTKDGTLKLGHAVDPLGSDQGIWWQRHYHGQPDLALNLPEKFHWVASGTDPNYLGKWYVGADRQSRSRMRRLFLLHNEPKTEDTDRLFVASSPTAGDIIYVLTTVYNYSLDTASGDFRVRFSHADYNPDLRDQEPDLTTIGEVKVDSLGPLEHRDVYVKWDTTGLGGDQPDTAKSYVIYVTVDPENDVKDEIHELYVADQSPTPGLCPTSTGQSKECGIFCGSNNQGFWPWDNSFKIFSPKQSEEPQGVREVDISIEPDSFEVWTTPESETYGAYIFTHAPYRLKCKIMADDADKTYREVFFCDNDQIFSVKRAFGLNPGENDFYCEWTPTKPGEHTLKVMLVEDDDDLHPGNNVATLDVLVRAFGIPRHR